MSACQARCTPPQDWGSIEAGAKGNVLTSIGGYVAGRKLLKVSGEMISIAARIALAALRWPPPVSAMRKRTLGTRRVTGIAHLPQRCALEPLEPSGALDNDSPPNRAAWQQVTRLKEF